jgi:hypothetical protein
MNINTISLPWWVMPKKWKPKRKSIKWMPCKVCIKKCCFKWMLLIFLLLFDVYQLYENIYQSKLSMTSPIIHNWII